jgi:seryl-tRNA synthetase
MLDIKYIRENKEKVKKGVADKQFDPTLVDDVLELDDKRKTILQEVEELRAKRNSNADELKRTAQSKQKPDSALINEGKKIKEELKEKEPKLSETEDKYLEALKKIPNPPAKDVKVGKDDSENEVIRKWGEPRKFDFTVKDSAQLGEELGIIDTERAAKVSGARFFYLKGDGVLLQFALEKLVMETLLKEGFVPVIPPVLIKRESMEGMGYMEHGGEDDMYVLEKDNLVLVATSEQSLGPLHSNEVLISKDLPRRYMGFSSCFRREAGSYGADTKGAFRVHQFQKVEMFSFVRPEEGDKEHEFLLSMEEKLLQAIKIPYQVAKMCSGDLGMPAARKYDLEGWFPSQEKYRELTSTSTTTDYQSRRLNIKYKEGEKTEYVHTLNGTGFSQRPILAILENYQQEDGSVVVPEVLRKWMGKEKITLSS